MKVISIWQPFASLIVEGCKVFETRSWSVPKYVIGTRIGIASTKTILPAQKAHCEDEVFRGWYAGTGLQDWKELPRGMLLGTVEVSSCHLMTPDFIEEVSDEEQAYGWWDEGNFAWALTKPRKLENPIPIRGMQGLYEWKGVLPDDQGVYTPEKEGEEIGKGRSKRPEDIRGYLRTV